MSSGPQAPIVVHAAMVSAEARDNFFVCYGSFERFCWSSKGFYVSYVLRMTSLQDNLHSFNIDQVPAEITLP